MYICSGNDMRNEGLEFSDIDVILEESNLTFDNQKAVFSYKNTKEVKQKKEEDDNLEKK